MASDLVTLSWCLGEIRQALNQAEQLLERHLHSEEGDLAALRAARSQLHQAHGALQVVDIEGVSLLTQESEALLDAVERGDVAFGVDIVSRLGQAAQAIVEYLEDLMQGGQAQPLHLYPYYRALLEARRAERVHPADLFFPDLAVTPSPAATPMMRADAAALAGARGAFERGLLQSIREPGSPAGPQLMHGSVRAVRESAHGAANRAFWWVTEVYFDALRRSLLPLDVAAKRLLARFNLQLRKTLEERAPVSDRLLKDMLFALAGAAPGDAAIDEVRRAYRLDGAIPPDFERPRFGRVDARAMRSAREALARARTAFDKVTRGSASDMPAFAKGVDDFRDAVEQLPAQGLQAIGRVLGDVRRTLNADSAYLPEPVALELATAILYAEQALAQGARPDTQHDHHGAEMAARLSGALAGRTPDADPPDWLRALSQAAQERLTMSTFIAEAQSSLRQVEKVLDGYFRDPSQAVNLPECVRAMHQVGGALRLLGHDAAARGAETVGAQVAAFADHAGESQSEQFEKVAASVGALGFFVEALQHPERASTQYEFDEQAGEFRAHLGLSPRDRASAESADAVAAKSPDALQAQAASAEADALAVSAGLVALTSALAMAGDSAPLQPSAAEGGVPVPEPVAPLSAEASLSALAQEAVPAYAAWQADPASGATLTGILQRMRDVAALVDDAGRKSACSQAMSLLQSPTPDASALRDALLSAGVPLPAPELPAAELPADDLAIDSELLEIFLAEADEVLEAIAEHVRLSAASPRDQDHLTTMRRGFHTLKGSSRMVGLNEFGEAGWAMEQVLNLWLGEERAGDADLYGLIERAHGQMGEWVERLRSGKGPRIDPTAIIEAAAALRRGEPLPALESGVPDVAVADSAVVAEPELESASLEEPVLEIPALEIPALEIPALDIPPLEEPVVEAAALGEFAALQPVAQEPMLDEPVFDEPVIQAAASAPALIDEPAPSEADLAEAVSDWPALEASAIDWQDDNRTVGELPVPETAPGDEMPLELGDAVAHTEDTVEFADADIGVDFGDLPLHAEDADTLLVDPTLAESAVAEPSADQAQWADADDDFVIGEPDAMELVQADAHDEATATAPDSAPELAAQEPLPSDLVRIGDRTISRPLYLIFLSEADELIQTLTADTAQWRETPVREASEAAMRAVHSLAGSAAVVELEPVHSLAETLDRAYAAQRLSAAVPDDEAFEILSRTVQRMHGMLHQFAGGAWPAADPEALAALAALVQRWAPPTRIADITGLPAASAFDAPVSADDYPEHRDDRDAEASLSSDAVAENSGPAMAEQPVDELDPELLAIFIEEADDDLPRIGENLRGWAANPGDARLPQTLMRLLHTVKGGARMAGAMRLGQKLHDTETRVETLAALPTTPVQLIEELVAEVDQAVALFEALKRPAAAVSVEPASPPCAAEPAAGEPAPTQAGAFASLPFDAPLVAGAAALAASGLAAASGSGDPIAPASARRAEGRQARSPTQPRRSAKPQDAAPAKAADLPVPASHPLVRVRADLLDKLVNEAGEVSIARSRLDNELTTLRQSLADLTENVGRLRSQLREIEIQADTQIQARIAKQKVHEGSFDPLEFDRYTRFQELTRMMAESVNDVATVQGNSMRSLDEASQDLHRQGQVLRDLQQNLMRVRMVQFGSISDRLYRVVRQSAKETDKRVHLDIRGASVEVDRGVLERMAGPIEHLLRNAVAHGIESAATRHAHGKSDTGEIQVEIRQEGREIVLSFNDDGSGLDLARIRLRAISQGLISEQSTPTDRELADLIFVPGFTTAASVTELSGRGVGMDVVRSEVASLGGRIETETQPGRGTRFTVHLPLTLAVAQVVLVAAGKSRFAVPSSSVEQVLQLKPQALASAYAERSVEWQGQNVPLFFLGSLVESPDVTPVAQHYSPVVIIRSGHQRIALHADEITRNQEVVVKNVGPQVARVRGVTGATVLGNGEIVLIVNPVALAQAAAGEVFDRAIPAPTITAVLPDALPPVVMVVDDSLTVRKVTQRLLTREGYQVLLAKDGVDALRQLQDVVPDAMLLDIEMPRMDGFDLTRNLRADERFAHMPIIMITSRTADKHRNHAMGLGVNVYLGKPYQEDELLAHLAHFTERRHRQAVGVTV
ncbi:MAG: Hpt domain-containing protein [Burkholderiaceae bacterium]|nr:Hpt domain-containing protein [Burkholderiaceae bacterium]